MKKVLKRILKLIAIIIWIILTLLIIYQLLFLYKFRNAWCLWTKEWCKPICQRLVKECYKRVRSDLVRGGRVVMMENYYNIPKGKCPSICLIYTEKNWYFIDLKKQEKYFKDKVKKCKEELKKKQEWWDLKMKISYCNEYWEIETPVN